MCHELAHDYMKTKITRDSYTIELKQELCKFTKKHIFSNRHFSNKRGKCKQCVRKDRIRK